MEGRFIARTRCALVLHKGRSGKQPRRFLRYVSHLYNSGSKFAIYAKTNIKLSHLCLSVLRLCVVIQETKI
jgi:hypothetical protein